MIPKSMAVFVMEKIKFMLIVILTLRTLCRYCKCLTSYNKKKKDELKCNSICVFIYYHCYLFIFAHN